MLMMSEAGGGRTDWSEMADTSKLYTVMKGEHIVGTVTSHSRFSDMTTPWGFSVLRGNWESELDEPDVIVSGMCGTMEECLAAIRGVAGDDVHIHKFDDCFTNLGPIAS